MARYTCSYLVKIPLEQLQAVLKTTFKACNFDLIYLKNDYLVAREIPGRVNFSRLVKIEVFVDPITATKEKLQINFIVKNEELPLQHDNYCHQRFNLLQKLIAQNERWKLLNNPSTEIQTSGEHLLV